MTVLGLYPIQPPGYANSGTLTHRPSQQLKAAWQQKHVLGYVV